jgi:putative membrane protein
MSPDASPPPLCRGHLPQLAKLRQVTVQPKVRPDVCHLRKESAQAEDDLATRCQVLEAATRNRSEPLPVDTPMGQIVRGFLKRWFVDTMALAAALLVPRVPAYSWQHLLLASLMLGLVNTFVRPILMLFALPLIFVTLGLFIFVINALMLLLVDQIVPGFQVGGLGPALGGALVITACSLVLERILGMNQRPTGSQPPRSRRDRRGPPPGSGPVIDV